MGVYTNQPSKKKSRGAENEDKVIFGKGIFYFGGNRGRGQAGPALWLVLVTERICCEKCARNPEFASVFMNIR